jgi:dihydrodipicolinate synthase/N-acetylneuraminate lyase
VFQGIRNKLGDSCKVNYAKAAMSLMRTGRKRNSAEPLTEAEKNEIDKAVDAAKKSDLARRGSG